MNSMRKMFVGKTEMNNGERERESGNIIKSNAINIMLYIIRGYILNSVSVFACVRAFICFCMCICLVQMNNFVGSESWHCINYNLLWYFNAYFKKKGKLSKHFPKTNQQNCLDLWSVGVCVNTNKKKRGNFK